MNRVMHRISSSAAPTSSSCICFCCCTLCDNSCTGSRCQTASSSNCVRLRVYRFLHGLAAHYLSNLCTPATVHAHMISSVTLVRSLSILQTIELNHTLESSFAIATWALRAYEAGGLWPLPHLVRKNQPWSKEK